MKIGTRTSRWGGQDGWWVLYDCIPVRLGDVGGVLTIDLLCGWVFHRARDKAESALRV